MITLYWQRDGLGRHVTWYLRHGRSYAARMAGRVSFNYNPYGRVEPRWKAEIWSDGWSVDDWILTGSTTAARSWVEREICRRSIGLFGVGDVVFERAEDVP